MEQPEHRSEEETEFEDEEVDPRIQGELEKLNQSTDDINRCETELEDSRQKFRSVLVEATVKLDELVKKIGKAVEESKPYWEARRLARQTEEEAATCSSPCPCSCESLGRDGRDRLHCVRLSWEDPVCMCSHRTDTHSGSVSGNSPFSAEMEAMLPPQGFWVFSKKALGLETHYLLEQISGRRLPGSGCWRQTTRFDLDSR
ncbi:unnamed protein product [Pleuronectes platessa]|uniref:SH3 domain-binding protein 5 n=1 Tax=Pleuronectes platessa TaxID=8262 RepID=A0A9N7V841_PLEPL|nr:unnamed protein product [Pleuronectes platessa]